MSGADGSDLPGSGDDLLPSSPRLANLEPLRAPRADGETHVMPLLGPMRFVRMPPPRPSFWRGTRSQLHSNHSVEVTCEVDEDALPGGDHEACAVAICRLQVQETMVCAQLVNARFEIEQPGRSVRPADLALTEIHLPSRPLVCGRWRVCFRDRRDAGMKFTVLFERSVASSVLIDSDRESSAYA
jgi:hypothetical protein